MKPLRSTAGHVLLATDKFKGSLTAAQATHHLTAGLRRAAPGIAIRAVPVADGGDGTVDAAVAAGFARVQTVVAGPTGEPVEARFAKRGDTAVIEVAEASGLRRLPGGRPAPLAASSFGTGQLMRAALDMGCTRIILGLGGSACTDGGAGMVQALGARLLDAEGRELAPGGAALRWLATVDVSALPTMELVVACDVDNPLLGEFGAAAVYGPQKGATREDVALLDAALARWAEVVGVGACFADRPGAGAAGGIGFAALALLGAELRSGIDLVLELSDFAAQAEGARLVITGEGALDSQSLRGKAPAGVARAAGGVPVVAVAGVCELSAEQLESAGIAAAYALSDLEPDLERCILDAGPLLEQLAEKIAAEYLVAVGS